MSSGDGPFGPVVNGTQIVFFEYRPNKPAAFTFVALFGLATLVHLILFFVLRAWYFIPFLLGGVAETFGYYGRAMASDKPDQVGPFILQNLLLLGGTPFLAATIYMSLGRMTTALESQGYSHISTRWLTAVYVLIDLGCIATQFIGSVIPASGDPSAATQGKVIVLSGLIIQLVAFFFFILLCWYIHKRLRRGDAYAIGDRGLARWPRYLIAIEVVMVLMITRSVVRTVEFGQGSDGFVITHEVFIYVFDATLIFLVMFILAVIHPSRLIREMRKSKGDSEGRFMLESRGG
ncbi:hypothetical protein M426DRAFT_90177 [Hypoxylon sp. CI-4A]|nr:hypothetical protein M426DRAFT_90177 [Hypoxylon sp. CI-4A]